MADDLRQNLHAAGLVLAMLGMVAGHVVAAELIDPLRPPAALLPGGDAAAEAPVGPVLQSVMMATGRKVAIISGQSVPVGGKFSDENGDKILVRLSDQEAVLRDGEGVLETLKMHPAIEKTVIKPVVDAKPAQSRKKRKAGMYRP